MGGEWCWPKELNLLGLGTNTPRGPLTQSSDVAVAYSHIYSLINSNLFIILSKCSKCEIPDFRLKQPNCSPQTVNISQVRDENLHSRKG